MAFVRVSLDSSVPIYRQIVDQLKDLVAGQQLKPGMQLPTVRQLATDLGIAVNTVARAFRELEREGIIVTGGRRGSVVAPRDHPRYSEAERYRRLSQALDQALVAGYHLRFSREEIRQIFEERLSAFEL